MDLPLRDWAMAGPEFTGCAAPQTVADLNRLPVDDDGRVDLVCFISERCP